MKERWFRILLVAVLLAGLAVRVYGAWLCRHDTSTDRGRVGLMAKHIAEGVEFPVFFYGGAYLGSVEPAASAAMIRMLGPGGFALNLGTALMAFLLLPVVYGWAREAGGRAAGIAATLFCVIGPFGYFFFMASPRGGYAATLLFSSIVLWLTGRLAFAETRKEPPSVWSYAALGVAAGLGWWANQLVTASLATAVFCIVAAARLRVFRARFFVAAAAFFVASAPWWIWNAAHDWATFNFLRSFGDRTTVANGLKLFFVDRFFSLTDLSLPPDALSIVALLIYIALLVAAVAVVARRALRGTFTLAETHVAVALLFLALSAALFSRSHYATNGSSRYLLPLVPVIAVLAGWAVARARGRVGRGVAWALLALLAATQVRGVVAAFTEGEHKDAAWGEVPALAGFCEARGIEVLYGNIWNHWINYASGERCTVADLMAEPYAPYEKKAELAERCGMLGDMENLGAFVNSSGGARAITELGGFRVQHDFRPPPRDARPVARERIGSVTDPRICDGSVGESLDFEVAPGGEEAIEIEFAKPLRVGGIRLRCREHYYPWLCVVEGRAPRSGRWRELLPETAGTLFFWSGPRWYWFGLFHRQEHRFDSREPVAALRVRFRGADRAYTVKLLEMDVLEKDKRLPDPAAADMDALIELLDKRGIRRLYADRWLSARVRRDSGGRIATIEPSFMGRTVHSLLHSPAAEYANLELLGRDAAFLVERYEAPRARSLMEDAGLRLREAEVGPWVLFDFEPGAWDERAAAFPGLQWAGYGCLKLGHDEYASRKAAWLCAGAAGADAGEKEALLREALETYPRSERAMAMLQEALEDRGDMDGAQAVLRRRAEAFVPPVASAVRFSNGAELRGVGTDTNEVARGGRFRLSYYWSCPAAAAGAPLVTFVHFEAGRGRYQDDHAFMEGVPEALIRNQASPEVFRVNREVRVPADAPPGVYAVKVGVYDPRTEERLGVKTALPKKRGAVTLPVRIVVR